ncbi:MAG: bifunctional chorismate mutase/prephenate dehydrogenase [Verrucomicrobiota bacterium]
MKNQLPAAAPTTEQAAQSELEGLRHEIDSIDEQIVHLLSQRFEKVHKVIALKQVHRMPVYHPAREENLISQRREQARRAGLDPDHIEELYRCIIRQSRVRQTVHVTRTGVRPGAKVLIVGGAGKMGSYFRHWFTESGYEVRILEVNDWPKVKELCAGIALAFVSVPIHLAAEICTQLGPHLPPDCILADITSIKQTPLNAMLAAHAGPVVGLHPLFGPTTSSMDKQVVVASPGRNPEACQWLTDQFTTWGNIVLSIQAQEHDEIMAVVQGVRHFATFAFGQFLYRRNIDLPRTLEFSSPIYRLELGMVGRFFAQDPLLYANILLASPERRVVLKEFLDSVAENRALLESCDTERFCAEYHKIAEWFGPFCEQSLRESSYLIDKLVERF